MVCSSGQSDLRTLAGKSVWAETDPSRGWQMQCRCWGGQLDELTKWNSVMRKGRGVEHQLGLVVSFSSS
jgi:hypothetical protein